MRSLVAALLGAVAVLPSVAYAGTSTNTFKVQTTVTASCKITPNDINLGTYDPTAGTTVQGNGVVSVVCTKGTTPVLSFAGANASGQTQYMIGSSTSTKLAYNLYSDSSYSTNLVGANTTLGTSDGSTAQTMTVYAKVAASQNVPADSYVDTVTVTASF